MQRAAGPLRPRGDGDDGLYEGAARDDAAIA